VAVLHEQAAGTGKGAAQRAIFISIDDREQAGLKLLCDSIFDESCFVADVS